VALGAQRAGGAFNSVPVCEMRLEQHHGAC